MHLYRPKTNVSVVNGVKPGNVLIARQLWNNELFSRSVILILEHDETGSTGIILNKTTLLSESLSMVTNKKLRYGGTYDTHRVGFIHSINDLPRAVQISEDLYFSENQAELEQHPAADLANVKAFVGFTVWEAGQLEQELADRKWWVNDFRMNELQQVNDNELWGYKLLSAGNIYGLFFDIPDPLLN